MESGYQSATVARSRPPKLSEDPRFTDDLDFDRVLGAAGFETLSSIPGLTRAAVSEPAAVQLLAIASRAALASLPPCHSPERIRCN